jgi:hypothetical protein
MLGYADHRPELPGNPVQIAPILQEPAQIARPRSEFWAMFAPNEIILPDDTKDHHVSFKPNDSFGYVYSKEPHQFERKFQSFDSWLPTVGRRAQSAKENRQLLEKTVKFLKKKRRPGDPVRQMIRDQPLEAQAAILAYFILDAQLTFVKT